MQYILNKPYHENFKNCPYRFLGIVVLFVVLSFLSPKKADVQRSEVVSVPASELYAYLSDFNNMNQWSPWYTFDSATQYEFFGDANTVGHGYTWKSAISDVGSGKMFFTALSPNQQLDYSLDFIEPFESHATGSFILEAVDSHSTKVTWTFHTDFGFESRAFMLFMDMDKMLGTDFEKGLKNLKEKKG
jgi:hypothetical protein